MCYWILNSTTQQFVVHSMVCSATNSIANQALDDIDQANSSTNPVVAYYGEYAINTDTNKYHQVQHIEGESIDYIGSVVQHNVTHGDEFDDNKWQTVEPAREKQKPTNDKATYNYKHAIVDQHNEYINRLQDINKIVQHRTNRGGKRKGKVDVLVNWTNNSTPTWIALDLLKQDAYKLCVEYAEKNNLLKYEGWKWAAIDANKV